MPQLDSSESLRSLALLYLAMGQGTDNFLSGNELDAITGQLYGRYPQKDRSEVQDAVGEAMAVYMEMENVLNVATNAIRSLHGSFTREERTGILQDLVAIAKADGVVLENELLLLDSLSDAWGIPYPHEAGRPAEAASGDTAAWGALHHLALIYVVLAHGTDNELSEQERDMMFSKLREWQPHHAEDEVKNVLEAALARYARGIDDEAFTASVLAVKAYLPTAQRMAALNDLVKIANADGVFLDREEDLINQMLSAWEVMPYANYGRHGSKGEGE